jgi:nucleoside-diphosphate-sugar epimerase
MKLLITGATGFIGSRLTSAALAVGHQVVALVRRDARDLPCEQLRCDLSSSVPLELGDHGIDVVIHLAAALSGPAESQNQLTVGGTAKLLDGMAAAGIRRLVGTSSLAVIDYPRLPAGTVVTESAPVLQGGRGVNAYARAKADQERLLHKFAARPGPCVTVLRPGLVYDDKMLSDAYAGLRAGPLRLDVSHPGDVPVTHCDALAQSLLLAAASSVPGCTLYHVLDDPLPDQRSYLRELRRRGRSAFGFSLDWRFFQAAAAAGQVVAGLLPVPEIFTAQGFATRLKPFRHSSARARQELQWTPAGGFAA